LTEGRPYDVVIVGCGPAGIFAALELVEKTELRILLLERGPDLTERQGAGQHLVKDWRISGWGGSGAFSDGKLSLSPEVGGWLQDYISRRELGRLIQHVDNIYVSFGAPAKLYGADEDRIREIERRAALAGMRLIRNRIRHLGTENCPHILEKMRGHIQRRAEIRTNLEVSKILTENGRVRGVETGDHERIYSKYVIAAPGRVGAEWLTAEAHKLGLRTLQNPVDLGVRVEVPADVLEEISRATYEPKFVYVSKTFDDPVRLFCLCPNGEVITEEYDDVTTVNGHSYAERPSKNTNFAILVSTNFTQPFKEPIAYGKYIARLANLLGGGIIVQRLGDLEMGRRSTEKRLQGNLVEPTLKEATPGDLSFALPYRHLTNVKEMLRALNQVAPGIYEKHTLLYGIEVKFYSSRMELNSSLETRVRNLFTVGDGAGITRGLMQASISGVIAAREIAKRETGT
jgi:uncharacterized FAD-dependent dehydrogenase